MFWFRVFFFKVGIKHFLCEKSPTDWGTVDLPDESESDEI